MDSAGIDYVADLAGFQQLHHIVALIHAADSIYFDTKLCNGFCRVRGCINFNAQIVEFLCQGYNLKAVMLAYADQRADFFRGGKLQIEACGSEPLKQGFCHRPSDPQHFSGGFHFRTKNGVHI